MDLVVKFAVHIPWEIILMENKCKDNEVISYSFFSVAV